MKWQVELYTFRLSGQEEPSPEELAGPIADRLSRIDILREIGVVARRWGPFEEGLIVIYVGDADDIEQAASALVRPGVRVLEETLGAAGHPAGV